MSQPLLQLNLFAPRILIKPKKCCFYQNLDKKNKPQELFPRYKQKGGCESGLFTYMGLLLSIKKTEKEHKAYLSQLIIARFFLTGCPAQPIISVAGQNRLAAILIKPPVFIALLKFFSNPIQLQPGPQNFQL